MPNIIINGTIYSGVKDEQVVLSYWIFDNYYMRWL
jgi:hypothetical protein